MVNIINLNSTTEPLLPTFFHNRSMFFRMIPLSKYSYNIEHI